MLYTYCDIAFIIKLLINKGCLTCKSNGKKLFIIIDQQIIEQLAIQLELAYIYYSSTVVVLGYFNEAPSNYEILL